MSKFTKSLILSILMAFIGFIIIFNIEGWPRSTGERNDRLLLIGVLSAFIFMILSLFSLIRANVERKKSQLIISLLTSIVPLSVFIMNGILFSIYFIGK